MSEGTPPLGTLTDRVTLQQKITTDEPEGGQVAVFTSIATVWARVRPMPTTRVGTGFRTR